MNMSLEEFQAFAETAPEGANIKKLAKLCGVILPEAPKEPVVIAPLTEQLSAVGTTTLTPKVTKSRPNPTPRDYVSVPSLKIDENTATRPVMINSRVARVVAERILAVCDEAGL